MSFREALGAHWQSGVHWLGYTIVGVIGLWGAALLFLALEDRPQWIRLLDQGQFFLYSVGFLTTSLYTLQKERKITTFPYRPFLSFSCFLGVMVSVLLFGGMTAATLANANEGNSFPGIAILRIVGTATFFVSLLTGLLVAIFAEARADLDIGSLREQGVQRLNDAFDRESGKAL